MRHALSGTQIVKQPCKKIGLLGVVRHASTEQTHSVGKCVTSSLKFCACHDKISNSILPSINNFLRVSIPQLRQEPDQVIPPPPSQIQNKALSRRGRIQVPVLIFRSNTLL